MDDKFLRDRIRDDEVDVPESLLPENISKKLDAGADNTKKQGVKTLSRNIRSFALAAAAVIVVAAGASMVSRLSPKNTSGSNEDIYEYEKMLETTTEETTGVTAGMEMTIYDELYEKLIGRNYIDDGYYIRNDSDITGSAETGAGHYDSAVNENVRNDITTDTASGSDSKDFSKNNDQEEGVSEGNIFITDGKYLYVMKKPDDVYVGTRSVSICAVDGGALDESSRIQPDKLAGYEYVDYNTMYVDGNVLVITGYAYSRYAYEPGCISFGMFYDISDKEAPKYINMVTQSGYYVSSRITDGVLYLISHYTPDYSCSEGEYESYIPMYDGMLAGGRNIYCPEYVNDRSYTVIGSVDLKNPMSYKDTEAVVLSSDNMYVSENAIYFLSYQPYMWYGYEIINDVENDELQTDGVQSEGITGYETEKSRSRLMKFSTENGNIEYAGETEVCGSADSQFSFSEYNGYIRIVTTTYDYSYYEPSCGLYIFDSDLKLVGSIEDIANGETVKSSRFLGNMAYFVTFRNTDPLFVVDMSDPADPVIVDELKLPGFSEYLHPYGEGKMLGLGYEADESNGRVSNVKMSMFDISDPYDISEENRLQLEAYYSGALYEHRAILVNAQRNLIGFSTEENIIEADETGANIVGKLAQIYRLYRYDDNDGFVELIECVLDVYSYDYPRAVYIGDYLYIFDGVESIYTYELNDYSLIGVTEF